MKTSKNIITGWFGFKCPRCRTGRMFLNNSVFPLREFLKMPERCHCCGQKMEPEPGFYYGSSYISYAIIAAILVFNLIWFALFIGFSWKNNSIYWYLGISIVLLALLQPWVKRLSRTILLSTHVHYDKNHPVLRKEESERIGVLQEGKGSLYPEASENHGQH